MRKILLLTVFIMAVLWWPADVQAYAPEVYGYVKTKTGMGIGGVAVKWMDAANNIRYTFTDSLGKFSFPTFNRLSREFRWRQYNNWLDTDLDGVPDARQSNVIPEAEGEEIHGGFGCSTNPQSITAVMPRAWKGAFSIPPPFEQFPGNEINNSVAWAKVVDIIYDPNAVTPTPVPPTVPYVPVTREPAICTCENSDLSGNFIVGGTMLFNIFVRSLYPDTTTIQNMIYHVAKNRVELGLPVAVPATLVAGSLGRYTSGWQYNIPAGDEAAGEYRIWADLVCSKKTANTLGVWAAPIPYYGLTGTVSVLAPTGVNTLQLGTFHPVINIRVGCKEVYFTIL